MARWCFISIDTRGSTNTSPKKENAAINSGRSFIGMRRETAMLGCRVPGPARCHTDHNLGMPRPLTFGNPMMHIGIDGRYWMRDLHASRPGGHLENHLNGHPIRLGFWTPNGFSWTDDPAWRIEMAREGAVGRTRLRHPGLGIDVTVTDALSGSRYVRLFEFAEGGHVRVFTSHDLRLCESDVGDTALYHPGIDALVHYKSTVWVGIAARTATGGLTGYATGIKGFDGLEGTWRDAEDGVLEGVPISQGSVDSTLCVELASAAGNWVEWALALGENVEELEGLLSSWPPATDAGPGFQGPDLVGVPEPWRALYRASLHQLEAHAHHGAAFLAALDSDIMATNRANYAYVWPRDGAIIAHALDRAGEPRMARAFYEFALTLVDEGGPRLYQKYHVNGSRGASWHPWVMEGARAHPHQGDQLALVLHALASHAPVGPLDAVREAAEFLLSDRDPATGLPLPSYDLWEERWGTHTFTVAAAIAGLRGAGKLLDEASWSEAAAEVAAALETHLVDPLTGRLLRGLDAEGRPDATPDASLLMVPLLGALPFEHPAVLASVPWLEEALWVHSPIGGIARYPGDYYFRRSDAYPGNPWVITTLWLARCRCRMPDGKRRAKELLDWACDRAHATGVLPEQVHPDTGEVLGVSPLAWSHAEFVHAVLDVARSL